MAVSSSKNRSSREWAWLDEKARREEPLDRSEAMCIAESSDRDLDAICQGASLARRKRFGDRATLCSILNAKSGLCPEDCAFCAQSSRHATQAPRFPLLREDAIRQARCEAAAVAPIGHYGVVASGKALSDSEIDRVCRAIRSGVEKEGEMPLWCASLGMLGEPQLRKLKQAGLRRYHHNLETAKSFFPKICTTHTYESRVETVRAAQRAGLEICCGGVFGLGESLAQRVELAFEISALAPRSVPLNFLAPIPGTPLEHAIPMSPGDILRAIALFRLVCPAAEIRVCAGREAHLAGWEPRIFEAGATGMMVGGYLTVRGRSVQDDLEMLRRAGMAYE